MYDLSTMFHSFYKKEVVLPKAEKTKLFDKKELNIKRLREGLVEYNEEKGTEYKIAESMVQGSVAMSTVIKNEKNDYDIDVAVVFEKDKIPAGTIAVKNFVVNALNRKCTGFKVPPYAKTNCVTIEYNDGYHIDIAIYRRFKDDNGDYQYEHCGSTWNKRDPKAITAWFLKENKDNNYQLREIVRLMKMFSKSRSDWRMPGGLIQSVLVAEKFQSYDRIDKRFYYTLKEIRDRLYWNKSIQNPTDTTLSLLLKESDTTKVNNLYNRLNSYLDKLDILFDSKCTKQQAIDAWKEFFNHDYWNQEVEERVSKSIYTLSENEDDQEFRETEEFIEYMFPIDLKYQVSLDCDITQDGWRKSKLREFLRSTGFLLPKKKLEFYAETNTPGSFDIYWKVKNKGIIAKKKNQVRGEIQKGTLTHTEHTKFKGEHFVEVFIVQNEVCVARSKINVPIATQ